MGQECGELVEGGGDAGFVEVHELVGGEAEDLAEIGAVAPGVEQVADAGEGVAPGLEPADQLEPNEVRRAVDPDPAAPPGRGEHAEGLVLADGADREPGPLGELIDTPLVRLAGSRLFGVCVHA